MAELWEDVQGPGCFAAMQLWGKEGEWAEKARAFFLMYVLPKEP